MRFIRTGDTHQGICPDANKPWDREYAQAIKDTFQIIIEKTEEISVNCLSISGDLFHRQPLMEDLREVNYLFSTIPFVKIILIAGNHDHTRENSALLSFIWGPNVTFIMGEDLTPVYFEDINTEIHGFSYHTAEIKAPSLEDIQAPLNSRIQILMVHGGDATHLPINFNSLELSPFSYIALGCIHKHHVLTDGRITYCGSPESLGPIETGSHGFYTGEIHPVTRGLIDLQFIPTASLQYIPFAVNVSKNTTNGELCGRISNETESRGLQHIYRFRIGGTRGPDIESDLEQFLARYRVTEITDDSKLQCDFSALLAEYSNDIIGFYTQALQKEDMSPVKGKALYYGVNALLHTTDGRS